MIKGLTKQKSFRKAWRFNLDEEAFIKKSIIGQSLNICCGQSRLGDVRIDLDEKHNPDVQMDYTDVFNEFGECCTDTVIFDPPFHDYWKHGLKRYVHKLASMASRRFIVKGWWFCHHIKGFDLPNIEIFYKVNKRLMIVQVYDRIPESLDEASNI